MLEAYWSRPELAANGMILLNLVGALAVGILLGYERSYHGRAAGMRTYALVCMSAAGLTVICAYPALWYGGQALVPASADATRVIQGIMTGIGFLGAGVIMKEGFSIRGLSTAASIWTAAAIGVLIGVGFYGAAILSAGLTIAVMSGFRWLELVLPHRTVLHLTLGYHRHQAPPEEAIRGLMHRHDFQVVDWAFELGGLDRFEYQLVLQANGPGRPNELVRALEAADDIVEFRLSPSRN